MWTAVLPMTHRKLQVFLNFIRITFAHGQTYFTFCLNPQQVAAEVNQLTKTVISEGLGMLP